jgi:phospholipase/carboxylesterase
MDKPRLSLEYLVRPPAPAIEQPPLLILLHGVGSNENDLFGLAPYLDERFLIVSARAPHRLFADGYGWYHVDFRPTGPVFDPAEAEASRQLLLRFIGEAASAFHADPKRIYLMGFSQGTIMSLCVMLTEPETISGVVAMSGRLITQESNMTEAAPERLKDFPVLVVHGTRDQTLPIPNGRAIRDHLAGLPANMIYREYPMGHEVSAQSLADVQTWLRARLDEGKDS